MLPSITSVLLSLGLLAIVYGLYSLILKPWIQLEFYRKQGCEMKFFPVLGNYKACLDTLKSHNDFYGNFKLQLKKNPELKGIGGNLLGSAQVYLTDPDEITEFYKQTEKYVRSTAGLDLFKLILGDGLVMINGEMWKRHRKIISSTFHFEFLKKILPDVGEIAQQFLENFKKKDLNEFALMHGFETITGEVVGRSFFGTKFSDYRVNGLPVTQFITDVAGRVGSEVFGPWYLLLGVWTIKCGLLPRFKTLMKDLDSLKSFVRNIIDTRREALQTGKNVDSDGTALIDALLMSGNMTSQEIIDEFITFFLGGMDTTGHNLGLSLYYLAKNPQYKQRLIDEANKYIGKPSEITIEKLNEMEFTTAFLKEGLRFSCPAAVLVDRVAIQDHKLHNLQIKKGTLVNVTLLGNGFNPKYHDDVDVFDPYRWINDTKTKRSVAESPRIYLPFSAGPQNCIGQHLAMNESKIILAMFLKKYDFELSPNYVHKMTLRLLHEPANTLTFKLIPK